MLKIEIFTSTKPIELEAYPHAVVRVSRSELGKRSRKTDGLIRQMGRAMLLVRPLAMDGRMNVDLHTAKGNSTGSVE